MIRRSRPAGEREIAFTTLIDLLVQIIFVFTLILISADAMEGEPRERGWVSPDAWKTLISIFDVDPERVRGASAQVTAIKGRFDRLKNDLSACDARLGACDRQAGRGPGNAPCRNEAGAEMVVAEATIDKEGQIIVAPGRHSAELQELRPLGPRAIGTPLSVHEFGALFRSWREHGLTREPPCAFKAEVSYDSRAQAGNYEPARRAIASYFTLSAPPRRF